MKLQELVERRKLEQVSKSITMIELTLIIERLLRLSRFDLISDDETLLLISGYIKMYEEARNEQAKQAKRSS